MITNTGLKLDRPIIYSERNKKLFFVFGSLILIIFLYYFLYVASYNAFAVALSVVILAYFVLSARLMFTDSYSQRVKYLLQNLPLVIFADVIIFVVFGAILLHVLSVKSYLLANYNDARTIFFLLMVFALAVMGVVKFFEVLNNYRGTHRVSRDIIVFRYGDIVENVYAKDVRLMGVTGDRRVYVASSLKEAIELMKWASSKTPESDHDTIRDLKVYLCIDPDFLVRDLVRRGYVYEMTNNCIIVKKKVVESPV